MKVALTGGTGFVGGHVLRRLIEAGHEVRALARRRMDPRPDVTWVEGDLANAAALDELVSDCDAVIHVAGVLSAPDPAGFEVGNVTGTAALLIAATSARVGRFVHTSSLSAREPSLSMYGGSKARSEAVVRAGTIPHAIVRPPAVYGPGDRETLDLFRMAKRGFILMPPAGRLSLIHVEDLADLLIALAASEERGLLIEPDDGRSNGWGHDEFGKALGAAVGRSAKTLATPKPLLSLASRADRLVRRSKAKLTADRVAYFCHPNWVVDPSHAAPPSLWAPRIETHQGLQQTADWYRAQGWL